MLRQKDKLIIASILFIMVSLSFVSANRYIYTEKNNTLSEYSFYSENSIVPFPEYSLAGRCGDRLVVNSTIGNTTIYNSLNIRIIESDCYSQFLYRLVNYMIENKNNVTIVYNENSTHEEISAVLNFASVLNISSVPYLKLQEINGSGVFIGYFNDISRNLDFNLEDDDSIIYVDDEQLSNITITGKNSSKIINLVNELINISSELSGDCVILTGCEIIQESKQISVKDVMSEIKRLFKNEVSMDSVLKTIREWLA